MGLLTGLTLPSTGDTSNAATDVTNNFNLVQTAVNNITTDQITAGTIINADLSASAEIAMSKITATASDATLQNVLENFMEGCWVYRVDGDNIGVTAGSVMINGELRRITAAITDTTYDAPTNDDWLDIWLLADTAASTFTVSVVDSGVAIGGSSNPGTNGRMVASLKYIDSTQKIVQIVNYRPDKVVGWDWKEGDGSTPYLEFVTTWGVTFESLPYVTLTPTTQADALPTGLDSFATGLGSKTVSPAVEDISTTACNIQLKAEVGTTFAGSKWFGVIWVAEGSY